MTPEELFENNRALVPFIFNRYFTDFPLTYYEDIIQEGNLALWRCCSRFDESKGAQFSTYACPSIYRQMCKYAKAQVYKYQAVMSFETVISDDNEGGELKLADVLDTCEDNSAKYLIQTCLSKLRDKERLVIEALMQGYTQDQVADQFGISQTTTSRILNRFRNILVKEKNNVNN